MSDTSQGPGWWRATDGKWYPPQPPVAQQPAPPPPTAAEAPQGPGWWQASDGRWYPPQPSGPVQVQVEVSTPKKPVYKRVWFWLLMIFLGFIVLIIALIAAAGTAINKANTTQHTIVYSVTGTGAATITYDSFDNNHNGTTQLGEVPLPWTKTVVGSGIFNSYSVTATLGAGGGTLTCTLSVDGKQVSNNTATGAFSSADCTGSA